MKEETSQSRDDGEHRMKQEPKIMDISILTRNNKNNEGGEDDKY
jgi:hypothetical protein